MAEPNDQPDATRHTPNVPQPVDTGPAAWDETIRGPGEIPGRPRPSSQRSEPMPNSEADYARRYDHMMAGRRNSDCSPAAIVGVLILVGIVAAMIVMGRDQPVSKELAYTTASLEIVEISGQVGTQKVGRGYRVLTPEWVILSTPHTVFEPDTHVTSLDRKQLTESRNFAHLCALAKQKGEAVTFIGVPMKDAIIDGKPVLIARTVKIGGLEFALKAE
jgi:hypothetical protein